MLALTMKPNPFFKSTSNRRVYRRNMCSMSFRWTLDGIFPMYTRQVGRRDIFFNKKKSTVYEFFKTLFTSWTYAETVFSIFDENISHTSISVKKSFDVPFSDVSWQISQENSSPFTGGHILENSVEKLVEFHMKI